jgi:hypothetical protein
MLQKFKYGTFLTLSLKLMHQAQASDQFLATTKLATNKAICLKTKNIEKSKMYF